MSVKLNISKRCMHKEDSRYQIFLGSDRVHAANREAQGRCVNRGHMPLALTLFLPSSESQAGKSTSVNGQRLCNQPQRCSLKESGSSPMSSSCASSKPTCLAGCQGQASKPLTYGGWKIPTLHLTVSPLMPYLHCLSSALSLTLHPSFPSSTSTSWSSPCPA